MRIPTEIVRFGEFWSVETPSDRFPGVLTIKDGGEIELEITSERTPFTGIDESKVGRIIGLLEKEGAVTLEGGFFMERSYPFGIPTKSKIKIYKAFLGASCDDNAPILFTGVSFRVDLLDEWLRITGINVSHSKDHRTATITYTPIDSIPATLSTGERVDISFQYSIPGGRSITEAKITHKAIITVHSEIPKDISHFITISFKLANLLSFATGKTVSLEDVKATIAKECTGDAKELTISTFYQSNPFTKKHPKTPWQQMLFTYKHVEHRWQETLRQWFDLYEKISPSLSLYFSTKTDAHKYLEGKFLSLAQSIETLSRRTNNPLLMDEQNFEALKDTILKSCPPGHEEWLEGRLRHGNEINLAKRIHLLIEPFQKRLGSAKKIKSFVRKVVDTRNYLTHYDNSKKESAASGIKMYDLCQKLEGIFELNTLHLLGFSATEINTICQAPNQLKEKIAITT